MPRRLVNSSISAPSVYVMSVRPPPLVHFLVMCDPFPAVSGLQGLATAFFSDSDAGLARSLMETLSETNQTVPGWLQNFASRMPGYGGGKGRRGGGRFGGRDARKEYGGGGYGAPAGGGGGYGGQAGGGYGGGGYGGGGRGGGGAGGYGGGGQNCESHPLRANVCLPYLPVCTDPLLSLSLFLPADGPPSAWD